MQKTATTEARALTRLMVGNLPYDVAKADMATALKPHCALGDIYLSPPRFADKNNGGWAIISVEEREAHRLLDAEILIGNRPARIKRARPQST